MTVIRTKTSLIDLNDVITEQEAAEIVKPFMCSRTLRQRRYDGRGPAYFQIGGRAFYLRSDVEQWIRDSRVEAASNASS